MNFSVVERTNSDLNMGKTVRCIHNLLQSNAFVTLTSFDTLFGTLRARIAPTRYALN